MEKRHVERGHTLVAVQAESSFAKFAVDKVDQNSWEFNNQEAYDKLVKMMAVTNITFHAAG